MQQLSFFYAFLSFFCIASALVTGFVVSFLNNSKLMWVNVINMLLILLASLLLINQPGMASFWPIIQAYGMEFGCINNELTQYMRLLIALVTSVVMLYATSYMEKNQQYFTSLLSIFAGFMLLFISSSNLISLFIGWEGVGLVSYLLIGYYFVKPSALRAASKAFIINRVGDAFLLLAIVMFGVHYGDFDLFRVTVDAMPINMLIGWFMLVGVMSKSAQFGLHVWLAEAMEGPTPVSALLHAATMVTAGVFLILRCQPLFSINLTLNSFIIYLGVITAIFAGFLSVYQDDFKKTIAYSTCAQLGLMVMGLGFGNYEAVFIHLISHGFFKALLFLGAGIIIHHTHTQSFTQLLKGNFALVKNLPMVFICMLLAASSLMGVSFTSGFFSKQLLLHNCHHGLPYILSSLASVLTAAYSAKIMLVFIKDFFNKGYVGFAKNLFNWDTMQWCLIILTPFSLLGSNYIIFYLEGLGIEKINYKNISYDHFYGAIKILCGLALAYGFYKKPISVEDVVNRVLYENLIWPMFKFKAHMVYIMEEKIYHIYHKFTQGLYHMGVYLTQCEGSKLNLYVTQVVMVLSAVMFLSML